MHVAIGFFAVIGVVAVVLVVAAIVSLFGEDKHPEQ